MGRVGAGGGGGLKRGMPAFAPGDTVRVMVRVREGEKERLQAFEGICIARRGGGINETFTVRKISAGGGGGRIFPLHAPPIARIGLMAKSIARRGGGINETFTVRKISAGVGVERIFPLHAPSIAEIGLMRKGRVRRAKLYFLWGLGG